MYIKKTQGSSEYFHKWRDGDPPRCELGTPSETESLGTGQEEVVLRGELPKKIGIYTVCQYQLNDADIPRVGLAVGNFQAEGDIVSFLIDCVCVVKKFKEKIYETCKQLH